MIYRGTVTGGVVVLVDGATLPEGTAVRVEAIAAPSPTESKQPRSSLADWAEQNAEHWGNKISAEDVARFTGRRL